ncbi:potassium/proton antiporter [Thalassovita gelatinovora]|uniref:Potassium/proton antiporter n=1 Tax=Thalassovita gelatinovora TaxID=53501 RepID=A0A0P1FEP0_THAGE|nr:sodium:proton antiporter [Thalassovita gelatinovora]QIZ79652.1 sodium:proton antiporter [Thalassovita gelatinovora]CUH66616.1 potassium/proton antiporter [Thalassovita gelatinovora]SEQ39039.1 sodium/proton antiporter, CPA1 family [Thalassovita gelatinovora]
MAIPGAEAGLTPITAIALVGALGVGAQYIAWRMQLPAIVLMLVAGIVAGPVTGLLDPARDIGPLVAPIVSLAVAIILFEGGLTLNRHKLRDAAKGVRRLVFIGAPLGWLSSALALHYGAGLGWATSAVFGGIMIVTGPTVIAPLLRQARLARRPAALLQWEAIVNDPIGALAAVLAFEVVIVRHTATTAGDAAQELILGIVLATVLGLAAGYGVAMAFKRGLVPEYMKVPVLFVVLVGVFALSDAGLHESGLLAVTIMGVVIANAELPSYVEIRRFKEHATVLLVSGVFILLAASLDFAMLERLNWRAALFIGLVIGVARPLTVVISLIGTGLPWREKLLIALTGPRGVVLVAVAGLFGERLAAVGIEDGALVAPLAFALVAVTVVLHGFTLKPVAQLLGLAGSDAPGVLLVGATGWSTALAEALQKAGVLVMLTDSNRGRLRNARQLGLPTFFGDVLSEAAEHNLELAQYVRLVALTDNDAYNTLVTTDLAPEYGRDNVFQLARAKEGQARHALPATLGGRVFAQGRSFDELQALTRAGWEFRTTTLSAEYDFEKWRAERPDALLVTAIYPKGELRFPREDSSLKGGEGVQLLYFSAPKPKPQGQA